MTTTTATRAATKRTTTTTYQPKLAWCWPNLKQQQQLDQEQQHQQKRQHQQQKIAATTTLMGCDSIKIVFIFSSICYSCDKGKTKSTFSLET